ncbi:MAG: S-layer homology domain-containing protein [Clostridia bacterium]|nr:S-layer homology domain-containing protein [Clostridia bacterium]
MKKILSLLLLAVLVFTAVPVAVNAAVSPAIDVISKSVTAVKAGLYNCDVVFTKTDFSQNLGLNKIGSVTFTSVPPAEDGYLYIANTVIKDGTRVSEDMLDLLRFRSASAEIDYTSFSYTINEKYSQAEHCFSIVYLEEINAAPVAAIPDDAPAFETYKNVSLYSRLSANDPEGDAISFKIISQPKKGTVELLSESYGDFKYTPKKNYTGKDTFCYVVCDKYGNYSAVEEVTIKTVKNKTKTVYSDVMNTEFEYAAIAVTANGIMSGTSIGGYSYFEPNGEVTRAEMLSYIMSAADIKLTKTTTDKFADFNDVPEKYRAYVATASEIGLINGSEINGAILFRPNEPVTRGEAAVMAKALINAEAEALATFADSSDCPVWCESAMKAAATYGLIPARNGILSYSDKLTRGEAAVLVNALYKMN